MSNYSTLKASIDANIRKNGRQLINGPVLNSVLNAMVNTLGDGYLFRGVAIPSTNPGTPDQNVAYLAITEGTYTHMGGLSVTDGELSVFSYNGAWSKIPLALVPTKTSQLDNDLRFVTSEEMGESLSSKQDTIQDLSEIRSGAALGATAYQKPSAGIPVSDMTDTVQQAISFAESTEKRSYNSSNPDGKGYLVLKKNKTFAEQVTEANTIYEIRDHFNLGGNSVNIPAGCTLKFNGGDISNGSVVYNNTEIQGEPIISCTCTGSLRNTVVTPQMYGAKGDGVTDDFYALQHAISYNDTMFVPAGTYIISNKILLTKNKTIYGVGKESKIHNNVVSGFEKYCFEAGSIEVGTAAQSFLTITPQACTIGADGWSVLISDTSDFSVGDIVYICLDATYTTKNPTYSWNAKVTAIEENTSITLDAYMDNDALVGQSCLVRNMKHLPAGSISENICIHDLSLANIVDSGSGMYVIGFSAYNANIYNIWAHGNTIFGSNYAVNVTIENVNATFDGGYADIPEISQHLIFRNNRGKRTGKRVNTIGLTFLAGYRVLIEGNEIDFGNLGKVGVLHHIRPIIRNNSFLNLRSDNKAIELSSFGNCVFENNYVSSSQSSPVVSASPINTSLYNVIKGNYFDISANRWLVNYSTIDLSKNLIKDNYSALNNVSDFAFLSLPDLSIASKQGRTIEGTTVTVAAGATYSVYTRNVFGIPRLFYGCILASGGYSLTIKSSNRNIVKNIRDACKVEIFKIGNSTYVDFLINGIPSRDTANSAVISEITLTNNGESQIQVYEAFFVPLIP